MHGSGVQGALHLSKSDEICPDSPPGSSNMLKDEGTKNQVHGTWIHTLGRRPIRDIRDTEGLQAKLSWQKPVWDIGNSQEWKNSLRNHRTNLPDQTQAQFDSNLHCLNMFELSQKVWPALEQLRTLT